MRKRTLTAINYKANLQNNTAQLQILDKKLKKEVKKSDKENNVQNINNINNATIPLPGEQS